MKGYLGLLWECRASSSSSQAVSHQGICPGRNLLSSELFICRWSLLGLMEVSAEPGSSGIFLSFSLDFKGGGLCCFCLFIGFHYHRCTPILWTVISSYVFAPPLFLLFILLPAFPVCSVHIFVFWYKYILWFCVRVFLTYINSMCSRSLSVSSSFHLAPFKKYFPWK